MLFTLEFLFNIVRGTLLGFINHLDSHLDKLWDAFPNPFSMLDVVVNFFTGLLGIFVSAPFEALKLSLLDRLRPHKVLNRLMTLEQAINLMFDAHSEVVRNITFTDQSGIVGWLAGWIGRFLWTWGKKIKLILQLLGAKTEEQVIQVVLKSLQSRFNLIRIILMVVAVLIAVEWVGFMLWNIGLCLLFIEGSATARLLPQDSRRRRLSFKSREVRINARTGPDRVRRPLAGSTVME